MHRLPGNDSVTSRLPFNSNWHTAVAGTVGDGVGAWVGTLVGVAVGPGSAEHDVEVISEVQLAYRYPSSLKLVNAPAAAALNVADVESPTAVAAAAR